MGLEADVAPDRLGPLRTRKGIAVTDAPMIVFGMASLVFCVHFGFRGLAGDIADE
jgi:hypothetical protein